MNKINKYLLAITAVMMLVFTSCKDTVEYVEAPAVSSNAAVVSFDKINVSEEFDPEDDTSLSFVVSREDATSAIELNVIFLKNDEGIFEAPDVLRFDAGQSTANLIVTFPKAELGTKYNFNITFDGDTFNPYKGAPLTGGSIQRIKWDTVGNGYFVDGTMSTFYNVNNNIAMQIFIQSTPLENGSTRYRFESPMAKVSTGHDELYGYDGYPYNDPGDIVEGKYYYIIDVKDNAATLQVTELGLDWGYGKAICGQIYGNLSTNIATYPLGVYEDDTITFGPSSLFASMETFNSGSRYVCANPTRIFFNAAAYKKYLGI